MINRPVNNSSALTSVPSSEQLRAERKPLAYGIPQVCRLTGLGRTTIYGAIKSGDLTARRYGRRTVVLEHDLLRFLDNLPAITSTETAAI
jgi:excisionase family DNA binding protein